MSFCTTSRISTLKCAYFAGARVVDTIRSNLRPEAILSRSGYAVQFLYFLPSSPSARVLRRRGTCRYEKEGNRLAAPLSPRLFDGGGAHQARPDAARLPEDRRRACLPHRRKRCLVE